MDNLDAGQVKAWAEAVGPTFMAFVGLAIVVKVLIVPMVQRERKESSGESELSVYQRLARMEERVGILWDEWRANK